VEIKKIKRLRKLCSCFCFLQLCTSCGIACSFSRYSSKMFRNSEAVQQATSDN